jgi:AcrR family transcriptional regulator
MDSKALDVEVARTGGETGRRRKLSPGPGLAAHEVAAHQLARIHEATIQIVAEQGYKDLKVRDVVRLAKVSTRAFYEHFGSKEDCFLQTYDLVFRRASQRIISAQAEEVEWRKRPRLAFEEFARALESDPNGARLALIEAYAVGEVALDRAWRSERIFEGMLAESFTRPPNGAVVSPMIVEGIVAGVATVSRRRLLAGSVAELQSSGEELVDWALAYPHKATAELAQLDRRPVWRDPALEPFADAAFSGDGESWSSIGDRALILAAVAELAVGGGYASLAAPRIRSAAGVSRRKFDALFESVEDCYLAALEQRAGEAFAEAARAKVAARSWPGGVYRVIAALCEQVAADAFLAKVCLGDDFPPGPNGALARQRLMAAIMELLCDGTPRSVRPAGLTGEASAGAVWGLFHHHIVRTWVLRRQISATLSYLALAPAVGAAKAIAAIQSEQTRAPSSAS